MYKSFPFCVDVILKHCSRVFNIVLWPFGQFLFNMYVNMYILVMSWCTAYENPKLKIRKYSGLQLFVIVQSHVSSFSFPIDSLWGSGQASLLANQGTVIPWSLNQVFVVLAVLIIIGGHTMTI